MGCRAWGLGLGFRVWGFGPGVQGFKGLGFRAWGFCGSERVLKAKFPVGVFFAFKVGNSTHPQKPQKPIRQEAHPADLHSTAPAARATVPAALSAPGKAPF